MYAGRLLESGSVAEVLQTPRHPYTYGLIASSPSNNQRGTPLRQIAGSTPALLNLPSGCAFRMRCAHADRICTATPPLEVDGTRSLRCFHPLKGDRKSVVEGKSVSVRVDHGGGRSIK